MYEGSLNQKFDGIIAEGGIKNPDGTWSGPNGETWDSGGTRIGIEPLGISETNTNAPLGFHNGEPYGQGSVDRAAGMGISIGDFLDGNWGDGGDQPFVGSADTSGLALSTPDATKISKGSDYFADQFARETANTPAWMTGYAGGDDEFIPEGAIGSPAPASTTPPWASSTRSQYTGGQVDEFGQPIVPNTYLNDPMFNIDKSIPTQWNQPDYDDSLPWFPQVTPEQIAASQPYDYGSEGGSLSADIEAEQARAFEASNRALAAQIIKDEARMRDVMANQSPPSASSFVTATQPRGSILKQDVPVTPYGTSFGGDDDFITTPVGVGTQQPPAPIYYPEDDIADYIAPAPAPVVSTPTPTPVSTAGAYGASARGGNYPSNEPHSSQIMQSVAYQPSWVEPAPEIEYDSRYYDEGANGMRTRERLSLVGESGPELALFPNGTEIIPLDRDMQPNQKKRLRKRRDFAKAIDSFEFGGYVGGMGPRVSDLPIGAQTNMAGITEIQSGRPTRAPRSLMRQAGMRAPSAQAISNLIPSEIAAYQEMALTQGGIGKADFEREFQSMVPMGQGGTRQARFTPRSTGRTRYGSI